jgi:hypothetical protein
MHTFQTHQAATLRHQQDLAAAAHRAPCTARIRVRLGLRWTRTQPVAERRSTAQVAVA